MVKLSPVEERFLQSHPVIRVANEMDWTPFDFVENGEPSGYAIDLLKRIAEKTGLTLTWVNGYTWDELLSLGRARKVDVFPAIWKTPERENYFHFTTPYIDTPFILVIHQDRKILTGIEALEGKVLTGIKGFASTQLVKQYYPGIRVTEVENAAAGLRMVSYGRADAYLGSMAETNYVIKSHLVPNLKISGETDLGGRIDIPLLHMAVRRDWPLLQQIIQKGMDAVTHREKQELQLKWLELENKTQTLILSETERAFLQSHPKINAGVFLTRPPVVFRGVGGRIEGIAPDYLGLIQSQLGIHVTPVVLKDHGDIFAAINSGRVDFVANISPAVPHNNTLIFTSPYLSFPMVIITREDVPYVGSLQFLSDKTVAVVADESAHIQLASKYPDLPLHLVDNTHDGLRAVAGKQAFAFVGNLATAGHVIGREGFTTLKVSGEMPYSVDIAMASPGTTPVLRDLLQKALEAVTVEDRNAIYSKWSSVTFEYKPDYSSMWKIGGAALFFFLLILYWNGRLRRMASDLEIARDAAEAANRAKSIFLANMSHELRTPLNAILGFSQLMGDDKGLSRTQKENLKIINSSGEHLLALISDILDMSKIEAGRIVLKASVFDLEKFLDRIDDMLRAMANEKGLTLSFDLSPGLPAAIKTDKARLRQVLVNLIVNGLKNTDKGGVRVRVSQAPGVSNEGGMSKDDEIVLHFTVTDTGKGIAPEFQHQVFEPFLQLGTGKQGEDLPGGEGTGLGLSICRTLVHLMGGEICLESDTGKGSSFSFSIRAGVAQSPGEESLIEPVSGDTCRIHRLAPGLDEIRVLVVDDSDNNRKLLATILENAGFTVQEASGGAEALAITADWSPHLIWMDIQMPGMDGLTATRHLRSKGLSDIKIIGISASAFEEDRSACLAAGCDDFISKPVKPAGVTDKMNQHLGDVLVCSEKRPETADDKDDGPLTPEAVDELPEDLRDDLKKAVFDFDYEMTMAVVEKVKAKHPGLGRQLSACAAGYQFGVLQSLFQKEEDTDE
ncbi:MAG: transporter substrate-binding domain-containing protein [Desulfobacterales bacterium]|nr:transporter substrate-binding domain-containing protein [Desulfobacterales bacterium]